MSPVFDNTPLVNIGVIGVGGAGCNAVNMMVQEGEITTLTSEQAASVERSYSIFNDIKVIAANTDSQDLENSPVKNKIQIGTEVTKGWGAGGKPDVGKESAEESKVEIAAALDGLDMVFITAGMGGGTGTGAAPIIASVAKEAGLLTVGIVTKPFNNEGRKKIKKADEAIEVLKNVVDTLVVIPNQKLMEMADPTDGAKEMFMRSNIVLLDAVRNIAEIISNKSLINVDFADVKSVMTNMGVAMIGFGSATGENAAINAVKEALNNPLLSDISIKGAKRALMHLGGMNIPMKDLDEASGYVNDQLHEDAVFQWGVSADESSDKVYALIIAEAISSKTSKESTSFKEISMGDQKTLFDIGVLSKESVKESVKETLIKDVTEDIDVVPDLAVAAFHDKDRIVRDQADSSIAPEEIIIDFSDDFEIDDITIPSYLRKRMSVDLTEESYADKEKSEKVSFMKR